MNILNASLKKILRIAGLVAGLAMIPIAANAQSLDGQSQELKQGKKGKKGKKGMRGHKGHGKAFKKALKASNIDAETQAKIKGVFEGYKPQMKALRDQVRVAHKSGDLLQVQAARLAVGEKRLEMMTDVRNQMSNAQWTAVNSNLKEMRAEHMKKRRGKRGKRSQK